MRFLKDTINVSRMLAYHPRVKNFQLVGSSLIDEDTAKDLDVLVLTDHAAFMSGSEDAGDGVTMSCDDHSARWAFGTEWSVIGGRYDDQTDKWGSLRSGDVNLIVTVDPEWYSRAVIANEVCCALKLLDKGDRIVVYRVIRDGYNAEQANARRDGSR